MPPARSTPPTDPPPRDRTTAPARARQPRLPLRVRQQQALDAARRLITRDGYHGLTMEAVAREAGLVKPVLYNAFAGIAPLLDALLQREARRATDALAIALGPEPEHRAPDTTLRWWLDSLTRAIADDPAPWRLILLSPEETPPVVRDRVERSRAFALGRAQQLTVGFLEQRGLSGEVDAELLAHSLLAAAEHAANLLVRDPAAYPPERLMAFVDSLLGLTPS